jgi:hypothetical protein
VRPFLLTLAVATVTVPLVLSSSASGASAGGALAVNAVSVHDGMTEQLQLHAQITDAATCDAKGTATYSNSESGSYEGTVVAMTIFGARALAVIRTDVATGVFANPSFPFALVQLTDGGLPRGGGDTMSGNTILDRWDNDFCFELGPATFFPLSSGNIMIR